MPNNNSYDTSPDTPSNLQQVLKIHHFLGLAFGAIIGVAWVVMLGAWLGRAGPFGAMAGFVLGGAVIVIVGMCYAEMATSYPASGSEIVFIQATFGSKLAFGVGWFLTLFWISVTSFEAVSVFWILEQLELPLVRIRMYTVLGHDMTVGALITGLAGMILFATLNLRGADWVARFQNVANSIFILGTFTFLVGGLAFGSLENLGSVSLTAMRGSAFAGVLWVIATCPFWLSGFQVIPQTIEEREPGAELKLVGKMIVLAIVLATIFYLVVILASSMAAPWHSLESADLAVAAAMQHAISSGFVYQAVLFAALIGLLTTWNAAFLSATRLLLALGRVQLLPKRFAETHTRFGTPHIAVYFVFGIGSCGFLLGRGAIVPIANMSSICIAIAFVLTCLAVVKRRRRGIFSTQGYRVPGNVLLPVVGVIGAAGMALYAFIDPLLRDSGRLPVEWWLLAAWAVIGYVLWSKFIERGEYVRAHDDNRISHPLSEDGRDL